MDDQRGDILAPPDREADRIDPSLEPARIQDAARPRRRSWRTAVVWLLVLAAIIGAVVWFLPGSEQKERAGGARRSFDMPTPVGVAPVAKGDMPIMLSGLGTVTPLATVTVKTQINGQLVEVGFQEGQLVKKGDFLAQIDPRPYQVALEQAQAQLAKDRALLKNAQLDLQRYDTLVAQNSIAKQTRDTQASLVTQYHATVAADQAAIDTQKLNLTYCRITSPVTGRVGLRQVDAGNYVQTSDPNGIVVVTQLQPISVIFTLPEDDLRQVLQHWHEGVTLPVTAYDRTGTTELAEGRLETIDNQIDTTTGTVKLRAVFANDPQILFPNQFVNIRLLVQTLREADLVPNAAVQRGAPGTFVYLVKPDNTVAVQKVKLGPTDGQHTVIRSGLQPGDKIVIDGADRLRDGAKIRVAEGGGAPGAQAEPPAKSSNQPGAERPQGERRNGGNRRATQ
jgi:multidrug efflux system membrane fusion protein